MLLVNKLSPTDVVLHLVINQCKPYNHFRWMQMLRHSDHHLQGCHTRNEALKNNYLSHEIKWRSGGARCEKWSTDSWQQLHDRIQRLECDT